MLLNISFRSFSNCELVDNFIDEKESTFNFTYDQSDERVFIKSISYSFALNRPTARNGAENITLSILTFPNFFSVISQFTDKFSIQIKKIHRILDKQPDDRVRILNELAELRKIISRIVLAYSKLDKNDEYVFL